VRLSLGFVGDISELTCTAAGDGRAIVFRVGDEVRAFQNRCIHQDSQLAGGWIRDGVLSCPLHFWRYRADDGRHIGTSKALVQYLVEVIDGQVFVEVPDDPVPQSLRQQLLERARDYDRDEVFRRQHNQPGSLT
jgi:nitrite reductase/ring-hydroxylating ferredoxin subunit